MIAKEELEDLYLNKRLTSRQIAKIYGLEKTTILRQLHKLGIKTTHEKRKFETKKKVHLTREQKEIVFGTMLGDGHIANHGNLARLMISHCAKQKELTEWLQKSLSPLSLETKEKIDGRTGFVYYDFNTVTHLEFKAIREIFYRNNVKIVPNNLAMWLTPLALSVWIMDDGTLNSGVNLRLQTDNFTEQENLELCRLFKLLFEINCKVCTYVRRDKKYHYLSFNKRNSQLVSDLVRPHIIPCMTYKVMPPSLND